MKVICIDKGSYRSLTVGKTYDVVRTSRDSILIINDAHYEDFYPSWFFKSLDEIRNERIDSILL